jgi:hypothetical protein
MLLIASGAQFKTWTTFALTDLFLKLEIPTHGYMPMSILPVLRCLGD